MLREEFESIYVSKVGHSLSIDDKDYEKIEYVYNWHPCNFSKEDIVSLYAEFGMCIIYDLMARAQLVADFKINLKRAKRALDDAQARFDKLRNTDLKSLEVLSEWLQN